LIITSILLFCINAPSLNVFVNEKIN
jgi:hypothetical protein